MKLIQTFKSLSWKRKAGALLSVLPLLLVAFYFEENWRGKRAWENYQKEARAQGAKFSLEELLPKKIPPEKNFALNPLFKNLFDYSFVGFNSNHLGGPSHEYKFHDPKIEELKSNVSLPFPDSIRKLDGIWRLGRRTDLKGWQSFFRGTLTRPDRKMSGGKEV